MLCLHKHFVDASRLVCCAVRSLAKSGKLERESSQALRSQASLSTSYINDERHVYMTLKPMVIRLLHFSYNRYNRCCIGHVSRRNVCLQRFLQHRDQNPIVTTTLLSPIHCLIHIPNLQPQSSQLLCSPTAHHQASPRQYDRTLFLSPIAP